MKTIPQRELRNNIARVLREVEAGEHIRITVNGRPVADLVPVEEEEGYPRTFVPAEVSDRILREAPLDPGFMKDVRGDKHTIDEMRWPPEMRWPKQDS